MDDDSAGWVAFIFIGLAIWGIYSFFHKDKEASYDSDTTAYSESRYSESEKDCNEPENPYDDGSGHDAGWQWGEEGNSCDGNSDSFIEGCEEYESAMEEYEMCLSR